jgi:hypothetical protein
MYPSAAPAGTCGAAADPWGDIMTMKGEEEEDVGADDCEDAEAAEDRGWLKPLVSPARPVLQLVPPLETEAEETGCIMVESSQNSYCTLYSMSRVQGDTWW